MNVVLIVSEGYPIKFSANNSKCEFIAMGLQNKGCKVTMIDNPFGTKGNHKLQKGVSNNNINYYILPRNGKYTVLLKNIPLLWKILKAEKDEKDNFAIIGLDLYPAFLVIVLITSLLGYKRTALFHEWDIGYPYQSQLYRIEAWIKDKTFGYFLNGIFPISHFLQSKSIQFHKPMLILPILSAYNRNTSQCYERTHFTFCGHVEYLLRNDIILKAFATVHQTNSKIKLILILVGPQKQFEIFKQVLHKFAIEETVIIKKQIPQDELYKIYDESIGLLIPLDPNNIRDEARFSQKIAEYIGSKRPIITNPVGEIPHYFTNKKSAVITNYSEISFAEAMLYLINNPNEADRIGLEGFVTGKKFFDFNANGEKIMNFLSRIK